MAPTGRSRRARTRTFPGPTTLGYRSGSANSSTVAAERQSSGDEARGASYPFRLTQRLVSRARLIDTGDPITRNFLQDDMGSSEFEFGARGRSFRRMQELGLHICVELDYEYFGVIRTIYFVGPTDGIEEKILAFGVWFFEKEAISQMGSEFHEVFLSNHNVGWKLERWRKGFIRTNAWWSFDCDIMWTLDEKLADLLMEGLCTVL